MMKEKVIHYFKEYRVEILILMFIVIRLFVGLFRVADYGISYDEGFGYTDFQMNDAYISEVFDQIIHNKPLVDTTGYESYFDKMYGVAARFPLMLFQHFVGERFQIRDIFLIHHYYNYIWFVAAVFSLFHLGRFLGFGRKESLCGCLMLVMMPRLFAEASYNYKDVLFLSLFIIAYTLSIWVLKKWTVHGMIIFSFFQALCINARYIGAIILFVFSVLFLWKTERFKWLKIGANMLTTALFYYIISPFLWKTPIKAMRELVAGFNHFSWNGPVKVWGDVFPATGLPWYYLLSYMLVTIPIWVIILMLAGIIKSGIAAVNRIRSDGMKWQTVKKYDPILMAKWMPGVLIIAVLLMDMIVHPVKYDGWRHFYFLYAMIIITAMNGLVFLLHLFKKRNYQRLFCMFLGTLVLADFLWMEVNHPYEYMYFNLVGRIAENGFDGDYWLISTYDAIRDVLRVSDRNDIRIWFSEEMAFYFLSDAEMERLVWQTDTAVGADVIIIHERTDFMFDLSDVDWSQYMLWEEKWIDSKLLYAIYLKKL